MGDWLVFNLSSLVFLHLISSSLSSFPQELQLCEEYDAQMTKWEKSVERIETNPKKKYIKEMSCFFKKISLPLLFSRLRDQKNRELFERHFPELKAKREHQERMTRWVCVCVFWSLPTPLPLITSMAPSLGVLDTFASLLRVDQRGYSIVRSDAELKEIMYELCEQEEGPVRYRKTHALIPPMLTQQCDKRVKFFNENGLISDPMALHRDSRFINVWSEEEKSIFRDK